MTFTACYAVVERKKKYICVCKSRLHRQRAKGRPNWQCIFSMQIACALSLSASAMYLCRAQVALEYISKDWCMSKIAADLWGQCAYHLCRLQRWRAFPRRQCPAPVTPACTPLTPSTSSCAPDSTDRHRIITLGACLLTIRSFSLTASFCNRKTYISIHLLDDVIYTQFISC